MKKFSGKVGSFVDGLSLKVVLQCTVIVFGVCGIILAGAIVFPGQPKETGQGGYESPAAVSKQETLISAAEAGLEENGAVLYTAEADVDVPELSYISYRIKQGDIIGRIASRFGISEDTIISVNNIRSSRTLQIGDCLKIPSISGILYTAKANETVGSIAEKYHIDAEKTAEVNGLAMNVSFDSGATIFLPGAKMDEMKKREIDGDLLRKPIRSSYYISSNFGWRSSPFTGLRSYHSGVDMACSQGTRIYAAAPGKVLEVGFNATYGNYIIIDHNNGYKALYGHMRSPSTQKRGNYVGFDTVIGYVGSTGMSTGPHLHFTLWKNGRQVDARKYWN